METEIARRTSAIESLGPTPSPKKKQVVETTCESHEKTSRDSLTKPGKLPLKKLFPPGEIS